MRQQKATIYLQSILLIVFVLLTGISTAFSAEPVEVTAQEVKEMMDQGNPMVIFPLSKIEFNNMHIEGSTHIPIEQVPAALPADKTMDLIFYCLGRT
jgi:hypothetical protein